MKKVITLEEKENLFINVYHLGYSKQGEGSVVILYTASGKVLYSLAIDCFTEQQCNMTDDILKHWKLKNRLNMFIWTHPHDDHSIGVDKMIDEYCRKESIICMANIFGMEEHCSEVCKNNIHYIRTLTHRKSVKNKWNIKPMSHFPEIIDEVLFDGACDIKSLTVQCISPFSELGGLEGSKGNPDFNMMGIGCILKIKIKNEYINFLFAGDMEYYTIEKLIEENDESIPTVYNYIKIPHHGSENAENMIEYLGLHEGLKSEFASTSIFLKYGLPKEKVLEKYKTVVKQISCTSDIIGKQYGLGAIKLVYDLQAKKVCHEFYGTAISL